MFVLLRIDPMDKTNLVVLMSALRMTYLYTVSSCGCLWPYPWSLEVMRSRDIKSQAHNTMAPIHGAFQCYSREVARSEEQSPSMNLRSCQALN